MAWIAVDLVGTLLEDLGTEDGQRAPIPGAPEAMMQLMQEGHRLTVFTSEFAPAPEREKQRIKEQIEQELAAYGFPPMEIWTGTTKPDADLYIGSDAVTFDKDWPLALAQVGVMLEDRGLAPGPQPDDGSMEGLEGGEESPPEEGQA